MSTHDRVLLFLGTLREAHADMVHIYTQGSCYRLYLLLRVAFNGCTPYSDINHVITKIEGRYYDITGEAQRTDKHRPMSARDRESQAPCRADGVLHFPGRRIHHPGDLTLEEQSRYCSPPTDDENC